MQKLFSGDFNTWNSTPIWEY